MTHVVVSRAIGDGVVKGANEHVHPCVTTSNSTSLSILIHINWHICNNNSWSPLAATTRRATLGLTEVAATNFIVWISPCQVEDIVFIPHAEDYINQIYGPVAVRMNTFFIRYAVIYSKGG